jgi:adenylate cyclase
MQPHAVEAALACHARLQSMQSDFTLPGDPVVSARIGLNTVEMLVGNMGSRRRLNYTVMGDAVNLASRLKGVNKVYSTTLLASADTRSRYQSHLLFREIDRVRVVGARAAWISMSRSASPGKLPTDACI